MSRHGYRSTSYGEAGQRPCAREDWCSSAVMVRLDDGSCRREPLPGPRAFCDRDRGLILERLKELPDGCRRLAAVAGALRKEGGGVRVPFGPSLLLHEGMDALRREMALSLAGWHARVAAVPGLSLSRPAVVQGGEDDGGQIVADAVRILAARIDTLLGLEPGWMTRAIPAASRLRPEIPRDPLAWPPSRTRAPDWLPQPGYVQPRRGSEPLRPEVAEEYGEYEIVRSGPGYLVPLVRIGGAAAGLEILDLHARCERLLGEVADRPETLDGVPCRQEDCEDFALERAEPPSDPSREAMHSVCASCRDTMTLKEFREWSARYARWADGTGLECARCLRGKHDQCTYDARISAHGGCACCAAGHAAA